MNILTKLALVSPWLDLVYLYYFKREGIHVHFFPEYLENIAVLWTVQLFLKQHAG